MCYVVAHVVNHASQSTLFLFELSLFLISFFELLVKLLSDLLTFKEECLEALTVLFEGLFSLTQFALLI